MASETDKINQISREDKNVVIKQLLAHRSRVATKMAIIAQDLMARSRRHDNSYSENAEMVIAVNANSPDSSVRKRYKKILKGVHDAMNDYCPAYFKNGIKGMTLIQLIEFISDRMARCEEESATDENGVPMKFSSEDYYNFMKDDFGIELSDDFRKVIMNTIECITDNNKYIRGMLMKKEMELQEYVEVKEK